jgi:predicted RNA binding protein YcfA (HicA-like mRNA interferase family)
LPKIYPTSWKIQVKIFEEFGCKFVRQKGDHLVFNYPGARRPVIIPKYDEITVAIIRINMRTVGMSREDYFKILDNI